MRYNRIAEAEAIEGLMNAPLRKLPLAARTDRPLAPSLERQRLRLFITLVVMDVAAIFASFLVAGALYLGEFPSDDALLEATLLAPLFLIIGMHGGFYKAELVSSIRKSIFPCIYILGISAAVLFFITFYAKTTANFSRGVFTLGSLLSMVTILLLRMGVMHVVKQRIGPSLHNTVIIYAGGPVIHMPNAFYIDAQEHGVSPDPSDPANLDRLGRYMQNMDRVVISCQPEDRDLWAPLLRAAGVQGEFVSEALRRLGALKIQREGGVATIIVSARPLGIGARAIKRMVDLTLSSIALLLFLPLMALVALLIKIEDGGSVLFLQRRMGRGNRFFWIYKFRSMRAELGDADGRRSTSRDDERTTAIGKFIRRTSIDELPQLFNVWRGDMSLVGPRPHALGSQAGERLFWEIDGRYWNRHVLKPGVTGLAQVRGLRGATACEQDLTDRLQADLEYIANWSLWLDIKIMLQTFGVIFHDKAY